MPAPVILALNAWDFGWIVLGLVIMFTALSVVVLSLTWLERKALGRLQRRLGPTRTGPMGLLQPVADAVKLILKEDIIPTSSEKAIFWAAPVIVVVSAFMIWVTIPGTQNAVLKNLENGPVLHHRLLGRGYSGVGAGGLGVGQQIWHPGRTPCRRPAHQL